MKDLYLTVVTDFIEQNYTEPYFIVIVLMMILILLSFIRWIIIVSSEPAQKARLIVKDVISKNRYSGCRTVHLDTLAKFNGYGKKADREVKRECQNIYKELKHNGKIFDDAEERLDGCYEDVDNKLFAEGLKKYLDKKYDVLKKLSPVDYTLYWKYTSPKGKRSHEDMRIYSYNRIKDYCHEKEVRSLSDDLNGEEFEDYIQDILKNNGIDATTTAVSNDYGADLIFTYNDEKFCVQCKCYSKAVGVKAVQEVIGSLPYYRADVAIVVTNNSFTKQARKLAMANHVLLIEGKDIDSLPDRIKKGYY